MKIPAPPRNRLMVLGVVSLLVGITTRAWSDDNTEVESKPVFEQPEIIIESHVEALDRYPCSECHESMVLDERRAKNPHRSLKHKHMESARTCSQCHNPDNMNQLVLATGEPVPLDTPQDLCGQCHSGEKASWNVGGHGKQVGSWNGPVHRLQCTDCHDAHSPAIAPMIADPPPPFPEFGIPKEAHE